MKVSRLVLALAITAAGSSAWATPTVASLGSSITISDENYRSVSSTLTPTQVFANWYANHEDNETEAFPTTLKGQQWDLETMYLKGRSLSLIGGFDFVNGTRYPDQTTGYIYRTGDIFIDVTGDARYSYSTNGSSGLSGTVANAFGYDYVIHFNSTVSTYSVFQINAQTLVSRGTDVAASNPWRYVSGGTAVSGFQNVSIGGYGLLGASVYSQLTSYGSPTLGLQGYLGNNNHYYLTVDTSFLPVNSLATYHYTIECGNDNLMGRSLTVPDAGSTVLMLMGAFGGVFVLRRKLVRR